MRRMYSVKELSEIISAVIDEKIEGGSFDEVIAGAVDDYLEEHPVDITALEGLDISVGSLDADGLVTGAEIIEKMSGYSFQPHADISTNGITLTYVGVCKNGNKVTFVIAGSFDSTKTPPTSTYLGTFTIPSAVGSKLYPMTGTYVDLKNVILLKSASSNVEKVFGMYKNTDTSFGSLAIGLDAGFDGSSSYVFRYEATFLLSDNLAQ